MKRVRIALMALAMVCGAAGGLFAQVEPQPLPGGAKDTGINVLFDSSHQFTFFHHWQCQAALRQAGYRVTGNQASLHRALVPGTQMRVRDQATHAWNIQRAFTTLPAPAFDVAFLYQHAIVQPYLAEEKAALRKFVEAGGGLVVDASVPGSPLAALLEEYGARLRADTVEVALAVRPVDPGREPGRMDRPAPDRRPVRRLAGRRRGRPEPRGAGLPACRQGRHRAARRSPAAAPEDRRQGAAASRAAGVGRREGSRQREGAGRRAPGAVGAGGAGRRVLPGEPDRRRRHPRPVLRQPAARDDCAREEPVPGSRRAPAEDAADAAESRRRLLHQPGGRRRRRMGGERGHAQDGRDDCHEARRHPLGAGARTGPHDVRPGGGRRHARDAGCRRGGARRTRGGSSGR